MSSKCSRRGSDYRRKKRKYFGNQHDCENTKDSQNKSDVFQASASAKKLCLDQQKEENIDSYDKNSGYRLVNIDILLSEVSKHLMCCYCHSKAMLKERVVYGMVSEFYIHCGSCRTQSTFQNSPVIGSSNHDYELNTRFTYAMRVIGIGFRGIKNFCTAMDLPPPVSQKPYERILKKIKIASFKVANDSMNKAAEEEVSMSESNDICVSGDGTWKTRGHTSRIGVCSVIGDLTGKVLDAEVLSSYCKGCDQWKSEKYGQAYYEWKLNHEPHCVKNHSGSSSKMEVEGMKKIFHRSLSNRKAKYVKYIGDGDTKTFPELEKTTPYAIEKIECVGHIQKRMGTRLRNLKLLYRGKKLSDGKSIGGKNRLTDKVIDKFTTYYGNAIRSNKSCIKEMRTSIWAIFCHYRSTDQEPLHHFCPVGADSWCDYNKAEFSGSVLSYKHKNKVPISVMDKIKPVFGELSAPKLLKKCLGGKTQNSNESYNSTVWKYCPKTSGSSKTVVDIAVNEATVMYNDGMLGRINIMKCLGLEVSHFAITSAMQADRVRIKEAKHKAKASSLEARRANRMSKKAANEKFIELEGITYESGAF